ncbi:MAG: peptide chain release factor-like protein [Planctomycetota bacterium]
MPPDVPAVHPAALPPDELLKACDVQRFRASGPGGQHRNKVETAVRLTHRPTGATGQATEKRSQHQNRQAALRRLRVNLALTVRGDASRSGPGERVPASACWSARVHGGRLAINPRHEDFPALLAEVLDHLAGQGHDPAAAARGLGVTVSQLLKLLRHEPRALAELNARRAEAGLSPMR